MRQPVALVGLVEQAMGMLRPPADAKGVTLLVDLLSDLPQWTRSVSTWDRCCVTCCKMPLPTHRPAASLR